MPPCNIVRRRTYQGGNLPLPSAMRLTKPHLPLTWESIIAATQPMCMVRYKRCAQCAHSAQYALLETLDPPFTMFGWGTMF